MLARIDRRRPELVVREELAPVTDEAIAALRAQPLYVRARMLVQLGQADGLEDPASRLTRPAGAPVIVPLTQASLRDLLDRAARWVKPAGRKQTQRVAALPPAWVAEQILARTAWPFPPLEGVVATPVLRPDGTVVFLGAGPDDRTRAVHGTWSSTGDRSLTLSSSAGTRRWTIVECSGAVLKVREG